MAFRQPRADRLDEGELPGMTHPKFLASVSASTAVRP